MYLSNDETRNEQAIAQHVLSPLRSSKKRDLSMEEMMGSDNLVDYPAPYASIMKNIPKLKKEDVTV